MKHTNHQRPSKPFFDRLPIIMIDQHRSLTKKAQEAAWRHGLDLSRKTQAWRVIQSIYDGLPVRNRRIALPPFCTAEIDEQQEVFGHPRKLITLAALHFALVDPYSPAYRPVFHAEIAPRMEGKFKK